MYMGVKGNKNINEKLRNISRLQNSDENIKIIKDRINHNISTQDRIGRIKDMCVIENGILLVQNHKEVKVIYLPQSLISGIVNQVHLEMGHQGAFKIIRYIKERFYWTGLSRSIKKIVRRCHICQLSKSNNVKYVGPCQSIVTKNIGDLVMADLYGPLPKGQYGSAFILVIQDSFSKFVQFYDLKRATARAVVGKVKQFISIIQMKTILTDNGSQFISDLWRNTLDELGIKVIYTTVRNPRPNTTERVNKEIGRLFRTYCHSNHKGWVSVLPKLEELYNNTCHDTTGFTPCEVLYGESNKLTFDSYLPGKSKTLDLDVVRDKVRQNLNTSSIKRQEKFNRTMRTVTFQIGDLVKIHKLNKSDAQKKITKKFELLYEGPYVVAAVPSNNVYVLLDPISNQLRGKFNAIHLSRYYQ